MNLWDFFYVDAETLKREEEAIQLDGLNVAQLKEIREKVRTTTYTYKNIPKQYTCLTIAHTPHFIHEN